MGGTEEAARRARVRRRLLLPARAARVDCGCAAPARARSTPSMLRGCGRVRAAPLPAPQAVPPGTHPPLPARRALAWRSRRARRALARLHARRAAQQRCCPAAHLRRDCAPRRTPKRRRHRVQRRPALPEAGFLLACATGAAAWRAPRAGRGASTRKERQERQGRGRWRWRW